MKRVYRHYIIDYRSRFGQLGRYCCRATCKENAVTNAIIYGTPTPYYIEQIICLEHKYTIKNRYYER